MELQTQKNNRMSKSESGRGSGGVAPGQQSKREEERKSDVDSRLRMMERFQEFSSHSNRDIIMYPEGVYGRKICIKFH